MEKKDKLVLLNEIYRRKFIPRKAKPAGAAGLLSSPLLIFSCKKILLMPGAAGGRSQMEAMSRELPDVLICGEIQEWETAAYVRDAQTKSQQLSLVVPGHIASEEPGSEYMADWLRKKIQRIKVTHIPAGNSQLFL